MVAISSSNETGGIIGFGGVSLAGVMDEDSQYSFNLNSAIIIDNIGAAVAVDVSAPMQVRLAATGDIIVGRLETFEQRYVEGIIVGTVSTEGGLVLPLDPTAGAVFPAVGDSVQGGVALGTVVKLAAAQGRNNVVLAVDSTVSMTCVVLFF